MLLPYSFIPSFWDLQNESLRDLIYLVTDLADNHKPLLLCENKSYILHKICNLTNKSDFPVHSKLLIQKALKKIVTAGKYVEFNSNSSSLKCNQNCSLTLDCLSSLQSYDNVVNQVFLANNDCIYSDIDQILILDNYAESAFKFMQRSGYQRFMKGENLISITNTLVPILRYTNEIIIYDRYIGECMKPRGFSKFCSQYADSLSFILNLIEQYAIFFPNVYVIGAVSNLAKTNLDLSNIKSCFDAYFANFSISNYSLKFLLKDVNMINDVEHDRFITTDKLTLKAHSGFDFIGVNNITKNNELSISEGQREVTKLKDEKCFNNYYSYSSI